MSQEANNGIVSILSKSLSVLSYGDIVVFKNDSAKRKHKVISAQIHKDNVVKYTVRDVKDETLTYTAVESEFNVVKENRRVVFTNEDNSKDAIHTIKEYMQLLNKSLTTVADRLDLLETGLEDRLDHLENKVTMIGESESLGFTLVSKNEIEDKTKVTPKYLPTAYYVRASSNCFVNDTFVLGGDFYMCVEYPDGSRQYHVRAIIPKPFYKRIFNTLLYGRYHMSNYDVVEPIHDFSIRCKNHIQSLIDTEYEAVLVTGMYALTRVYP